MADEAKTAPPKKEEESVYHVDRLTAEAPAFFGVASHVAAGAFHGLAKKHLTRDEAQKRIERWLETPVAVDQGS